MEFLNIGGGELLIIVLLALILFGPEDIIKMMRTLGKYTRQARDMWNQFSATLEQEYSAAGELSEVIDETKEVMNSIKSSVNEISSSVTSNVAAAQKVLEAETRESAVAIEETARLATQTLSGDGAPSSTPETEPSLPTAAIADVDEAEQVPAADAEPETVESDPVAEASPSEASDPAPLEERVEVAEVEVITEVEATEVAATEVAATEVEATEVEATEVAATEVETTEVAATEVEATEVEATEVETTEVEATEVEATEVEATEVETTEVEATEVEATEVEATADSEQTDAGADGDSDPAADLPDETDTAVEVETAADTMLEGVNGSDGDHATLAASDAVADPEVDMEAVEAGEDRA
jgi:Tat protein translocase TatB subunit